MGYIYRCIGMNKALECSPNYPHTRLSTTRSHVRASDFRWGGRRGGGGIFYNVLRLRLSFQVVPDLCFRIILDLVSGLARAPWKIVLDPDPVGHGHEVGPAVTKLLWSSWPPGPANILDPVTETINNLAN